MHSQNAICSFTTFVINSRHIKDIWRLRSPLYTEFGSSCAEHSGLTWGAIFRQAKQCNSFQRYFSALGTMLPNKATPRNVNNHISNISRTTLKVGDSKFQYVQDHRKHIENIVPVFPRIHITLEHILTVSPASQRISGTSWTISQ